MDAQMQTWILVAAGAAVKWARAFPRFNDVWTIVVSVAAAGAMAFLSHPVDVAAFFNHFGTDIQTVLATLGAGHLVAKMTAGKIVPVNNQYAPNGGK